MPLIQVPPTELQELYIGNTSDSRRFLKLSRIINNAFGFASLGTSTKRGNMRVIPGRGPNTFQIKGSLYHIVGTLIPPQDKPRL